MTYEKPFVHRQNNNQPLAFDYGQREQIDESILEEEEIIKTLFKMKNWKAPGMAGIKVDFIKTWFHMSHPREEEGVVDKEALGNWKKVVEIVRLYFEGDNPKANTIRVQVIIPKDDKGGVRGIGLLEATRKLVNCAINMRTQAVVSLSQEVHGVRAKCGCITVVREAKICMQVATCNNKTT